MSQNNGPQAFRESIRLVGANETVDVPLAEINAAGTALTMNSSAIATTHSGLSTFSGGLKRQVEVVTGDEVVTTAMSGRTFICTKSSATQTFTLPTAATGALEYTFICGHASGEILVNPTGTNTFAIKASAGGASVVTASSTGIKNTAATNILGDSITLVSDGVSQWYGYAQNGIWATQ